MYRPSSMAQVKEVASFRYNRKQDKWVRKNAAGKVEVVKMYPDEMLKFQIETTAAFYALDMDGDGALSRAELLVWAHVAFATPGALLPGTAVVPVGWWGVTVPEWLVEGRPVATPDDLVDSWLGRFDAGKTGSLAPDEFYAMMLQSGVNWKKCFPSRKETHARLLKRSWRSRLGLQTDL
jgi:hypothetical protein